MNEARALPAAANEAQLDAFSLYLNELSLQPMLTAEDEVRLAREIEAGKQAACRLEEFAARASAEFGVVELEERDALLSVVRRGALARDRFAEANLRLVVSVAKRYQGNGIDLPDLVQEGNCGLLRALDKFDYTLGYRFSTYATWWIRQAIGRALVDKARMIRLPAHVAALASRKRYVRRELSQELGREPTFEEIAAEMGLREVGDSKLPDRASGTVTATTEDAVARRTRAIVKASVLHALMAEPLSLDSARDNDANSDLGDLIIDSSAADPHEIVAHYALVEELSVLLSRLTERERFVLSLRFGLADGSEWTLAAIGKHLNLTRERVRQIQMAAIHKLRAPRQKRVLPKLAVAA